MDRPGHPGSPAAGSGEAAVEAEGVTKVFGAGDDAVVALDEVSITIRQNEFFTLLGPSGCGKTTLLRLIAGFEHPTAGRILLDGEDIGALLPFKRPVNTVFQSYALFPHMTVAGNIAFGLEMLGRPKREVAETVVEMLRLVRMEALAGRRTSQLSGGQQQRVALAPATRLRDTDLHPAMPAPGGGDLHQDLEQHPEIGRARPPGRPSRPGGPPPRRGRGAVSTGVTM